MKSVPALNPAIPKPISAELMPPSRQADQGRSVRSPNTASPRPSGSPREGRPSRHEMNESVEMYQAADTNQEMDPAFQPHQRTVPQSPATNRRNPIATTRATPTRQPPKTKRQRLRTPVKLPEHNITINRVEFDSAPSAPLASIIPMRNISPMVPIMKPQKKAIKKSRKSSSITVLHKGTEKTLQRNTLRRYNWSLKDRFDQTNFKPEAVVSPRKVEWPKQRSCYSVRDIGKSRDLSKSAFVNPVHFFDNRDNFEALCDAAGINVKARAKPRKPRKKRV